MTTDREIWSLYDRAGELPKQSEVALSLLEQAVRLADVASDVPVAWDMRKRLIERCLFTQTWDRFFVHFAWMVARHDEEPARYTTHTILWHYKWAIESCLLDPNVSAARVDGLLDDFERRLREAGHSLRTVHHMRHYRARAFGDHDALARHLEGWRDGRRDRMSDCLVCELDQMGQSLLVLDRAEEALELFASILGHPQPCAEVPAVTRGNMLHPLWARRERRRASALHRRGYEDVRRTKFLDAQVKHLAYEAARFTDEGVLLAMIERHLPAGVEQLAAPRLELYRATAFGLRRIAARRATVPLRLPEPLAVPSEGGHIELSALLRRLDEEIAALGDAFDRRHGNRNERDRTERYEALWAR